MDRILLLMSVLALLKSVEMVGLWPGKWGGFIAGGIGAAFVLVMHSVVLGLGKPAVDAWISAYGSLLDLSLWVMVDLLLTAALCRAVMQRWFGVRLKRKERWRLYCPSVVLFPALLYLHICLFYWFPGMDFGRGTAAYAGFVFVFMSGGSWGIRKLMPEVELRLELTATLALLLFIVTVGCTILHPSTRMPAIGRPTDWIQTFEVAGVLLSLPLTGLILWKCRRRKKGNL